MAVNVTIPIRVRVAAADLAGRPDELADAVGRATSQALAGAGAVVPGTQGGGLPARLHPATVSWVGPGVADVPAEVRASTETRLADAVGTAGAGAPTAPPARAVRAERPWLVRQAVDFHARLRVLLEFLEGLAPEPAGYADVYADLLDRRWAATAWIVEARRTVTAGELAEAAYAAAGRAHPRQYLLYWSATTEPIRQQLAAADEDHTVRRIPPLDRANAGRVAGNGPGALLQPGARLLFVFLAVPERRLEDIATLGAEVVVPITVRDLDLLVDPDGFERRLSVAWSAWRAEFGAEAAELHLLPVYPNQPLRLETLRHFARRAAGASLPPDGVMVGELLLLTGATLARLPAPARAAAAELTDADTLRLDEGRGKGTWDPDWSGAYVYTIIRSDPGRIATARYAPDARAKADRLIRLLQQDPRELTWPDAMKTFLDGYVLDAPNLRQVAGDAFGFLLAELEAREGGRWFRRLFDAVEASRNWVVHQLLVRLALHSRYAGHQRVAVSVQLLNQRRRGTFDHEFRVAEQEIWLHGSQSKRVAGERSTSGAPRVMASVSRLYLLTEERKRLREAKRAELEIALWDIALKRLKAIGASTEQRTLTSDELLDEVLKEAVKRVGLRDDDIETYKVERSILVVSLASKVEDGVERTWITFDYVEREGDGPWQPVQGGRRELSDSELNEKLWFWEFDKSAAATEFLSKLVLGGAVLAIAWEVEAIAVLVRLAGGLTAVLTSVALFEVLYLVTAKHYTPEGFLRAAIDGYLFAVGFRIPAGAGLSIAERIGAETLRRQLFGWLAQRAFVGVVGGAISAPIVQFHHDIADVMLGRRQGEGMSTPAQYLETMGWGALLGLAAELVAGAAAPGLRAALRPEIASVVEAAAAIRQAGISPARWAAMVDEATTSLSVQFQGYLQEGPLNAAMRVFRERLKAVTVEYRLSLVERALEVGRIGLSAAARSGLRKLAGVPGEEAAALLERLRAAPAGTPRALEALDRLDPATLGNVPRVLGFLRGPADAESLLAYLGRSTDPAKAAATLERYLGRYADRPLEELRGAVAESSAESLEIEMAIEDELEALGPVEPAGAAPLDQPGAPAPPPPVRTFREALDAVDISGLSPAERAELRRAWRRYVARKGAGRKLRTEDDYVRFRHGKRTGQLPSVARPPAPPRPGWVEQEAGRVLQRMVDAHLPPGSANVDEFPTPYGRVRPDHLPPGVSTVQLPDGTRFSARFVGDSKYLEGRVPTTDQTRGFVTLAALSDERALVLYVRWRDNFPAPATLTPDPLYGYQLPPALTAGLVEPGVRDLAARLGVTIRLVSEPRMR